MAILFAMMEEALLAIFGLVFVFDYSATSGITPKAAFALGRSPTMYANTTQNSVWLPSKPKRHERQKTSSAAAVLHFLT
jgi:hypothetical protein